MRLTAAAELAYGRTRFTKDDFDNSEQKFGEDMLEEFMDEISATYDEPGRKAILSILRGKNYAFTREDILSRMNAVADKNKEVKRLRDRLGVDNLLRLLFRVGLIGNHFTNENKKVRQLWAVRGEANPLLEERFVLHQSVRAALSTL